MGGRLDGKVALVVGGGATGEVPGTGSAMARSFAREGAHVAVMGRSREHTERTVAQIAEEGSEGVAVLGDASRDDDCARAVAETVAALGGLDVLVNNLGTTIGTGAADFDRAVWDQSVAVNTTSILQMTHHALPHLTARPGGSVITISSVAGLATSVGSASVGGLPYDATKAMIIAMTRSLAAELGPMGVRVNCIVPGHLATTAKSAEGRAELRRELSMLRTEGDGWDVGHAAVFLASDEARFITAVALPVDGGASAQMVFTTFLRMREAGF